MDTDLKQLSTAMATQKKHHQNTKNRSTFLVGFFTFLLCSISLISCTSKNDKLNIAVASNMQFAIKELSKEFTIKTGIDCNLIISSSGKLTAQIKEGAPFDVFVSADMRYPNELFDAGFTSEAPKVYAFGTLVMWSMIDTIHPSIELLNHPSINHIAIANPKTAPYGKASIEVLKQYDIYEKIVDKLVFGESISQANQFIISKSAEIGFTSKSVVLSSKLKQQGNWKEIEKTGYHGIAQGIVTLSKNQNKQNISTMFSEFLFTDEAQKILKKHGYLLNNIKTSEQIFN